MRKITQNFIIVLSIMAFVVVSIPISATTTYAQSATTASSGAAGCDEQFYSNNDILFYSACATSCSGSAGAGNGTVDTVHGKNNGEKIFNFWVDSGLTPQQAAGITGSLKNESGFSAFKHEIGKNKDGTPFTFDQAGWGLAQFTGGQRDTIKTFLLGALGPDLFNQYYKGDYGGFAPESTGFIPAGVPVDVNDKFLIGELNYLLQMSKSLVPNNIRTSNLRADYNQTIPASVTLYNYLKTLVLAGDSAIAWTYLYEYPGEIKATAQRRANDAADIMTLFSTGTSTGTACGGSLSEGGMNLQEGVAFMEKYKNDASNVQYIAGAGQDCPGGPLSNCVSFSVFFVRKYTSLKESGAAGNGSTVVAHLISLNPTAENGHSPRPYAIFSTPSGSQMCGDIKCGHTGVILGVDKTKGIVVVGEAACGAASDWDTARSYPLSKFDSNAYTYIYTDGLLKGAVQ